MTIYPDRVGIRRVTYDLSDVRWLDVYEVEDVAGYSQIGRSTIPHIINYFELVFSVQTLLPDLKVERHVGVDDRTGGPFWPIVNAMSGR